MATSVAPAMTGAAASEVVAQGGGEDRVFPGLRANDQAAICADRAGFTTSFRCSRCSEEGKPHRGRLCTRCTLRDRLRELLGDDAGVIRPELTPLVNSLLAAQHPPGSAARYEARIGDNHHHVVCRSCGAIADVDCAAGG